MAHVSGNDLHDVQYDVLWESTENNPQLPSSPISTMNKALQTRNKRVIGAVNEINKSCESVKTSLSTMATDYNNLLGDTKADPTLLDKLHEIDVNVVLSIYKLFCTLNNGKALPEVSEGNSVIELITKMQNEIKSLKEKVERLENNSGTGGGEGDASCELNNRAYAEDSLTYLDSNTFKLSHEDIILDDLELLINGIEYKIDEAFTVDKKAGTLTWLGTASADGFDLDPSFDITVQYWYNKK